MDMLCITNWSQSRPLGHWLLLPTLFYSVAEIGVKRLDVDLLVEWAALVNS